MIAKSYSPKVMDVTLRPRNVLSTNYKNILNNEHLTAYQIEQHAFAVILLLYTTQA
jgi:hypothetical protein